MNLIILAAATAIVAFLAIWFSYRQPHLGFYLCKPLTTILILLLPILANQHLSLYSVFILAGLGFSLLGDIFLMLPEDRFLSGMAAFFLAHLAYITAFAFGLRELFWEPALVIYGMVALAILALYRHLGNLEIPVYLYMGAISVMAWMAWSRWMGELRPDALLAACGGTLFLVSDLILALDRFRARFNAARGLNLLTYYAAQWLIALSAAVFS